MYDYETTADLNEAIYYERLDADIEMAQMEAEGRRISALHKRGICTHGAGLGYKAPAIYSAEDIAGMLSQGPPRQPRRLHRRPGRHRRGQRPLHRLRRDPERPMTTNETTYQSQAARDAQRFGYGGQRYWDYLDEAALQDPRLLGAQGRQRPGRAAMLTRSLSEALRGNDGD